MPIQINQLPFKLTAADMGVPDLMTAISGGMKPAADLATLRYKNAMADYLQSPGKFLSGFSEVGKSYVEPYIINRVTGQYEKNPDYNPSAARQQGYQGQSQNQPQDEESGGIYPTGEDLSQGNYIPPRSNIFQDYANYRDKKTSDPIIKRNAQSAQLLMNEINDIDTKPLEEFSGLLGKGKSWINAAKMATGIGEVDPMYRRYDSYMTVQKTIIMDQIRKTLATSIVPNYVFNTIAPLSDPTSSIWSDPQQVVNRINTLKDWVNGYAREQTESYAGGVPKTIEEARRRHLQGNRQTPQPMNDQNAGQEAPETSNVDANDAGVRLLAKQMVIPSFKSKEQFQDWFNRQPSITKKAIRMKLGEE